jgi:hypothetical protein
VGILVKFEPYSVLDLTRFSVSLGKDWSGTSACAVGETCYAQNECKDILQYIIHLHNSRALPY